MAEWQFLLDENIDPKVATYLDKEGLYASTFGTLSAAKQAIDLVNEDAHLEQIIKFDSDEPYRVPVREME